MKKITLVGALLLVLIAPSGAQESDRLDVARFDADGNLLLPPDFDQWVFLGSSLGQQYDAETFDPDSPGMFQVVRMEPTAYAAFLETGEFVDGTMLALHFYGAQEKVSINRGGFVMSGLHFAEIHYKDSKYPDGFNFFTFTPGAEIATEVALPNDCVDCHRQDGAYDGVFVQFYPDFQRHLPDDIQAWLKQESSPH